MKSDSQTDFLRKLDTSVWVEKRLFPARLLVLDEATSSDKAGKFITGLLEILASTEKDKNYVGGNFTDVALVAAQQLKLTPEFIAANPVCSFSTLEQFLSDLQVYGLRESLAYLFEGPDSKFDEEFENHLVSEYSNIGHNFLLYAERIRKRLELTYRKFLKNQGVPLSNVVDRLIVADAVNFNGAWADGQPQHSLSE